ncbi:MAG: transposase [Nanoarchaeota archaeon]|nr:transposase [Nanoarchaeota archaeon]MBU4241850.1 transposase [Nanoarchaeota archaeon]MBU4351761.1 transposase [Nanoarchaeota archaeon]MBU4456842.1 transposase [Nanoarchaeota archaeon]
MNKYQTNGKAERFFLIYKTEFATGSFSSLKDFIKHYNKSHPYMRLHYKTPKEVWDSFKVP